MITYCCDRCKKAIEEDDIEAIEVEQMKYKMLFSRKWESLRLDCEEEFKPIRQNTTNENQNHHYCGECKGYFYELT